MGRGKNILFYAILIFLLVVTITNIVMVIRIDELKSHKISGNSYYKEGWVSMCLVSDVERPQFIIRMNCNIQIEGPEADHIDMYEYQNLFCTISIVNDSNQLDMDAKQVVLTFVNDGNRTALTGMNLTDKGFTQRTLNFTAAQRNVGNHSFIIIAATGFGCGERESGKPFFIEVINVNDPPIQIKKIPNVKWQQDNSISPFDLDTFFYDQDRDKLTYTVYGNSKITIVIDASGEVTLIPAAGWSGVEEVYFVATDPYGLYNVSNKVKLTVEKVQDDEDKSSSSGGGGGGGGSGGIAGSYIPPCISQWTCGPWGECLPSNERHRICIDEKNCTVPLNKPNETEPCVYRHTCFDNILGPLEEQIDCGGPCPPCPSCKDGIKNQDEDGIDCGGQCEPCKVTEFKPGVIKMLESPVRIKAFRRGVGHVFIGVLIATVLIYAIYRMHPHKLIIPILLKRRRRKALMLDLSAKETLLERLAKLEKRIPHTTREVLVIEFASITREYFKRLFGLDYEFTYEEMIQDLKTREEDDKLKKILIYFFTKSTELEFSGSINISKKDIQARIDEFRSIIEVTSLRQPEAIKPKTPEDQVKLAEYNLDMIFLNISRAHMALKRDDINSAYKLYVSLLAEYNKLGAKEKARVHGFLSRLYMEIKGKREALSSGQA